MTRWPAIRVLIICNFKKPKLIFTVVGIQRKDDNDWVKRCMTWEAEGIRQEMMP